MEAGIQGAQQRTVNELGVVNPYDTETVAERVYAAIEAHQSDIDVNLRQKYKALYGEELMDQMIQFADDTADPILSTHAFLESKKPKNIKDIEYEKVMQVLEDIIPDGRKIETLDDLNQFRTQFQERMITAFRKNEITKIGKGTFVDDVYAISPMTCIMRLGKLWGSHFEMMSSQRIPLGKRRWMTETPTRVCSFIVRRTWLIL